MKIQCPFCRTDFSTREIREHHCIANQHAKLTKQQFWVAEETARTAMGLPPKTYGYDVTYTCHDGGTGNFHIAGSETAARRKASLQRLFKEITSIHAFTYRQYVNAFGIPGSKM